MSFVVKRLKEAEEDIFEAARWYEDREFGLGNDFLQEVAGAVSALERNALLHRIRFADVRRAPVRRFKFYGVYYIIRGEEAWVIAVYHGRRHPRWLEQRRRDLG